MSKRVIVQTSREVYPFGIFSLSFISISLFGTLLLKHPANDPTVISIADYLLIMGTLSLIFVIVYSLTTRPTSTINYNIVGLFASFLIGLGLIALMKSFHLAIFSIGGVNLLDVFFVNPVLAELSTYGLPTEISMFFVASIEELTFRIAIPVIIYVFFPVDIGVESRWFTALVGSSFLFGMWHIFAYNGDITLMATAIVAGALLSFAYRVGVWMGGHDLAFIGIVGGHYFWNLVASNYTSSLFAIVAYFTVVTLFALFVSGESQGTTMKYINSVIRGIRK